MKYAILLSICLIVRVSHTQTTEPDSSRPEPVQIHPIDPATDARWTTLTDDYNGLVFQYDKSSIHKRNTHIYSAWGRNFPIKDSLRSIQRKKFRFWDENKKYLTYSYEEVEYKFDCENQQYATIQIVDYNTNGETIAFYPISESKQRWQGIPPDSILEDFLNAACGSH